MPNLLINDRNLFFSFFFLLFFFSLFLLFSNSSYNLASYFVRDYSLLIWIIFLVAIQPAKYAPRWNSQEPIVPGFRNAGMASIFPPKNHPTFIFRLYHYLDFISPWVVFLNYFFLQKIVGIFFQFFFHYLTLFLRQAMFKIVSLEKFHLSTLLLFYCPSFLFKCFPNAVFPKKVVNSHSPPPPPNFSEIFIFSR